MYTDIQKEIYHEEFAHMMATEAKEPHDLPSASWGPRKAGGGILVQTQRS